MRLDDGVLVATVNVNGIRAAFRRGMAGWLAVRRPDVVLLQETRAGEEHLRDHLDAATWHLAHAESATKGRAGVTIASRLPMRAVRVGLDQGVVSNSGRWVEAELELPDGGVLTVVSTYIHSGTLQTPSMAEKYVFLDLITARLSDLRDAGDVVVGGDVNIAHRDVDLKNWKGNLNAAGCLPDERAYLDRWFGAGWVDVGRRLGGAGPGPYTWWSWRGKAFDNDAGWRIDYQIATPGLAARARTSEVDRAPSYAERFSDHAPLVVDYDLPGATTATDTSG
jgi:exodeoxyribonuclease-3